MGQKAKQAPPTKADEKKLKGRQQPIESEEEEFDDLEDGVEEGELEGGFEEGMEEGMEEGFEEGLEEGMMEDGMEEGQEEGELDGNEFDENMIGRGPGIPQDHNEPGNILLIRFR